MEPRFQPPAQRRLRFPRWFAGEQSPDAAVREPGYQASGTLTVRPSSRSTTGGIAGDADAVGMRMSQVSRGSSHAMLPGNDRRVPIGAGSEDRLSAIHRRASRAYGVPINSVRRYPPPKRLSSAGTNVRIVSRWVRRAANMRAGAAACPREDAGVDSVHLGTQLRRRCRSVRSRSLRLMTRMMVTTGSSSRKTMR